MCEGILVEVVEVWGYLDPHVSVIAALGMSP